MLQFILGTVTGFCIYYLSSPSTHTHTTYKTTGWTEVTPKSVTKPKLKQIETKSTDETLFSSDKYPVDNKKIIDFIDQYKNNIQITTSINNDIVIFIPLDDKIIIKFPHFTWHDEYVLNLNTFKTKFMQDNMCKKTTIIKRQPIDKETFMNNYLLYRVIDDYYNAPLKFTQSNQTQPYSTSQSFVGSVAPSYSTVSNINGQYPTAPSII